VTMLALAERRFGPFILCDVPADASQAKDVARGVAQRQLGRQKRSFLAIGTKEGFLAIMQGLASANDLLVVLHKRTGVLWRAPVEHGLAVQLGFGPGAE